MNNISPLPKYPKISISDKENGVYKYSTVCYIERKSIVYEVIISTIYTRKSRDLFDDHVTTYLMYWEPNEHLKLNVVEGIEPTHKDKKIVRRVTKNNNAISNGISLKK